MENEKTPLHIHLIRFLLVAIFLVFVVAFVHDLITGQLPDFGGGGGYSEDGGYDGFGRR